MTAAPTAIATAVKQATVKARIFFLLILKSLAQLQVASLSFGSKTLCSAQARKGLRFEIHKGSPEQANSCVKIGCFSVFEVEKKAPDPWRKVLLKELTLGVGWCRNAAIGEACHDFKKNCGVIFRFRAPGCYLDTETMKRFSQSRERASV
jgi:hypothetical protein